MKLLMYPSILLLAGLAACGGGSDAGIAETLGSAALSGAVYELDGQTANRSDVAVTLLETGESVVTGPDGSFAFDHIPTGDVTLQFGTARAALAQSGSPDDDGDDDGLDDDGDDAGIDADGIDDDGADDSDDDGDDDDGADDDGADDGDDDDGDDEGDADDDREDEDDDEGRSNLLRIRNQERVQVSCALRDGEISEFKMADDSRRIARSRLSRADGSADSDVTGKVKVRIEDNDEKFEIEAEHLAPGTVVECFLEDPSKEDGFVSIGTATADSGGEAELEFETDEGDRLPFGVESVEDLAGFGVEVRLVSSGEPLLLGEVPDLPDPSQKPGMTPSSGEQGRGRGRLSPMGDGGRLECEIEIRTRPERGEERFKVELEGIAPGTPVALWIEDPGQGGEFKFVARRVADHDGEAEFKMAGGSSMPLGVDSVRELVSLEVRLVLDDGSDEILCAGFVPALVVD